MASCFIAVRLNTFWSYQRSSRRRPRGAGVSPRPLTDQAFLL